MTMTDLAKRFDHYRQRMDDAMKARNLTNEMLGDLIGSHSVTISKLRTGKTNLDDEWRFKVATALAMSEDILFGEAPLPSPQPWQVHKQKKRGPKAAVSGILDVFGLAAGSIQGHTTMTTERIEEVPRPAGLKNSLNAYALRTSGESMIPRYFPRDILYINPDQDVRAGDHVVIQVRMHDQAGIETWVKRFDGYENDEVLTWQYNPPARLTFKRRFVISIHRVLPVNELYV